MNTANVTGARLSTDNFCLYSSKCYNYDFRKYQQEGLPAHFMRNVRKRLIKHINYFIIYSFFNKYSIFAQNTFCNRMERPNRYCIFQI